MRDFKTLTVWQKAHQLTLGVYRVTRDYPREEVYGLTSQMRRCSASIPANLAEGFARYGSSERAQFVSIAAGSAGELEYFLLLSRDLELIRPDDYERLNGLVVEVERMLNALHSKIKADASTSRR